MENLETRGVIKWAANCKVTGLVAADAATTKTNRAPKSGATTTQKLIQKTFVIVAKIMKMNCQQFSHSNPNFDKKKSKN